MKLQISCNKQEMAKINKNKAMFQDLTNGYVQGGFAQKEAEAKAYKVITGEELGLKPREIKSPAKMGTISKKKARDAVKKVSEKRKKPVHTANAATAKEISKASKITNKDKKVAESALKKVSKKKKVSKRKKEDNWTIENTYLSLHNSKMTIDTIILVLGDISKVLSDMQESSPDWMKKRCNKFLTRLDKEVVVPVNRLSDQLKTHRHTDLNRQKKKK